MISFLKRCLLKFVVRQKKKKSGFVEAAADASDVALANYAKERGRDVTLLLIGANNGVENDPYVHRALQYGWRAVLVEPNPSVFRELQSTFKDVEGVSCVNAAVADHAGSLILYAIAFSDKRWATGLTSSSEATLRKHFDNGWVTLMCERFGDILPEDPNQWVRSIEVHCKTVVQVALEAGVERIDVLAVDTEGMDAEIVNHALDAGCQPEIICWEHLHLPEKVNGRLVRRCEGLGYKVSRDTNNMVCYRQFY